MKAGTYLPLERVWSRIDRSAGPDACWPFTGMRDGSGYGRFRLRGRVTTVTRVVMELETGIPVPRDKSVLHACDNPPCANPRHLRIGTHQDNSDDMVERGRQADHRNERSGMTKLTNWQVSHIRRAWINGARQKDLAEEFRVHPAHVSRIVRELRRPPEGNPDWPISIDWTARQKADRESAEAYWNEAARLYRAGMTMAEVGSQLGCNPANLSRRLRRMGVATRKKVDYRNQINPDELRRLHADGVRVGRMVKELGVCRTRIEAAMAELGLSRFGPGNPNGFGRAA